MKEKSRGKRIRTGLLMFYERNTALSILSIFSILVVLLFYGTYGMNEIFPGAGRLFELLNIFCIGILINLIFYIFQVYLPLRGDEEKKMQQVMPQLLGVYDGIATILLVAQHYLIGVEEGRFNVQNRVVYFRVFGDGTTRGKWAGKVDLNTDFVVYIESAMEKISKIMSWQVFWGCPKYIIELICALEQNLFLKSLRNAGKEEYRADLTFVDVKSDYVEFCSIVSKFSVIGKNFSSRRLVELGESEIEQFEKKIAKQNMPEMLNQKNVFTYVRI